MSLRAPPLTWRFLLITLATLLGVGVTASLGRWQLARAAQKEAIHSTMLQREALPMPDGAALRAALPVAGDSEAQPQALEPLLHRRVVLQGHWQSHATVFLDNRQMDGRPGFFVMTPLQLDAGPAVLVQRGWVPRNFEDRTRLPAVETPAGTVQVQGRIEAPPSKLFDFGASDASEGSSRIRQNLDLPEFRRETGLPLAALSVVQTGDASEGLQRRWPEIASGVERHYGYAFQWFGLCALIAFLYVWFQFVRKA
ncbi:SURF1 family protein [Xylophilus sp. ASV27]|uniref:SURF1 family protein n=1 Tax=Xylophilus sp. ASV27 TaxID=2795129 RepID=UPI00351C5D61